MADETANQGEGQQAQPDPISNLKSEFNRKFDNLNGTVSQLAEANKALMAQLQTAFQPQQQQTRQDGDEIKKVWYDDPSKAAQIIEERTAQKIRKEYQEQQKVQAKTNQVLNQLVYDYPELQNDATDLSKKAVQIYMGLDDEEKKSPVAYKYAVKEAAETLGIKPRSKRTDDDSFSVSSGSSAQPAKASKSQKGKLAAETVAFAKLVGLNTDDPKVMERIEKRQRENWTRYR